MRPVLSDADFEEIVQKYTLLTTGEVIAIPVPGLDLATVFATWGKMVQDIGRGYGFDPSLEDAKKLSWLFLRHMISAGGAWFASAPIAQSILKAIPIGGTLVAYLVDATIAAASMSQITKTLAGSAREYFAALPTEEEPAKEKKKRSLSDAFSQVVSAGQSLASIVGGIRKK